MRKTKTRGNGEGTIFKRTRNGKTMWVMEYTLGKTSEGKIKRKTVYGKTQTEVKEKYKQLLIQLGTNTYVDKSRITFEQLCLESIEKSYKLNHLKPSSYIRKKGTLNQILEHPIGKKALQDITEKDVESFLIYITKFANSTIEKIYGLTGATLRKAVKDRIIPYNFLDDKDEFPLPKSKTIDEKIEALTINEQKKLLNILSSEEIIYKLQYLLELYTGMRMGEILALTLDDIDADCDIIHVNKTLTKNENDKTILGETTKTYASTRDLHIEHFIIEMILSYIDLHYIPNECGLIFYNQKNVYFSVSQINSAFKRLCQKYDINKGWNVNQHMLRHTFATRCIESGMPANVLAKILGHKNIRTTLEVYCDVFAEYERKHSINAMNYLKENDLIIRTAIVQQCQRI